MSVIPVDEPPSVAGRAIAPGFWQRFAAALDEFFLDRSKRAVSEAALSRSRLEVRRCRQLMLGGVTAKPHRSVEGELR
jgi:hypothetical protein